MRSGAQAFQARGRKESGLSGPQRWGWPYSDGAGGFYAALRSYGTATAKVLLLNGLRQADFFVGTTILEVKSGRLDQDLYVLQLINQMISYALLARFDGYPVTHVAAYAIRYQRLLRFRIEPFLARLADRRLDLGKASAEFASILQDPSYRTAA